MLQGDTGDAHRGSQRSARRDRSPGRTSVAGRGFAGVPDAELDVLAAVMSEVVVDSGATVVTVDTFGAGIYVIERCSGRVMCSERSRCF